MGGIFKKPKKPKPVVIQPPVEEPTPDPAMEAAATEAARKEAERLKKRRRGYRANILTGPQGLGMGANVFRATLG